MMTIYHHLTYYKNVGLFSVRNFVSSTFNFLHTIHIAFEFSFLCGLPLFEPFIPRTYK